MKLVVWLAALAAAPAGAQESAQRPLTPRDTLVCRVRSEAGPSAVCVAEPPEIVKQGRLAYPPRLAEAGIEGDVVVQMIVDTSGRPELASIVFVAPVDPDFEASVRAWVPTLEFQPARVGGRNVRVLIKLPVQFHLRARVGEETSARLLEAANAQIAGHNLDSAATLLRRVAEAPARAIPERVKAWVFLGVVGFYSTGDSAAATAFRQALALDPGLQAALDQYDPEIARIFAAERAALPPRTPVPAAPEAPVHDCLGRCPEGVRPAQFAFVPHLEFTNASVGLHDRRMRTFLTLHAVIGADGVIEPETIIVSGGTARGTETELRRGLIQARFTPGRADGVPCRTRVTLRFDFEAEGTSWVKYTYRVQSR